LLPRNIKLKIYRTIILPVVWYGCETWSLILRKKGRLRVFANILLRRLFGPKRDVVTGEWRKLHNDELNDLYVSPNMIQANKLRRMRWARQVACIGRETQRILWGNIRERDYLEDPGVDGRIISRWNFRKWDGVWTGLIWLGIFTGGGHL
jgi:hypothetical protein